MDNLSGWQQYLKLCTQMGSPKELEEFLDLFLTLEEKTHLANRYLIIKALMENKMTQREIAATYNVSIAQITRGSNALKIISPSMRKKLQQFLERK